MRASRISKNCNMKYVVTPKKNPRNADKLALVFIKSSPFIYYITANLKSKLANKLEYFYLIEQYFKKDRDIKISVFSFLFSFIFI